jgi:hypothetical protein
MRAVLLPSKGVQIPIKRDFGAVGLGTDTGNSIRGPASHKAVKRCRSIDRLSRASGKCTDRSQISGSFDHLVGNGEQRWRHGQFDIAGCGTPLPQCGELRHVGLGRPAAEIASWPLARAPGAARPQPCQSAPKFDPPYCLT